MHFWKLTTALFATLFAVTIAIHHTPPARADRQPQMHDALRSLNDAAKHLERASSDKGGHRVNALRLTKQAITEVQAGINFDNRR